MIRSIFLFALSLYVFSPALWADESSLKEANSFFERGQKHYAQGEYDVALNYFKKADKIAPHYSTQFNIGRCLENLGKIKDAIDLYRTLAKKTDDQTKRDALNRRILALSKRKGELLVTSMPDGAEIYLDARRDKVGIAPKLLSVRPDKHLLILKKKGYRDSLYYLELLPAEKKSVKISLEKITPVKTDILPCRNIEKEERDDFVDIDKLHIQLSLMHGIMLDPDRGISSGPALSVYLSLKRWIFGTQFNIDIDGEEAKVDEQFPVNGQDFNRFSFRRTQLMAEGGRLFSHSRFVFHLVFSAGMQVDRSIVAPDSGADIVREKFAFIWGLGAGMRVYATDWLSLGLGLRAGMGHGDRADPDHLMDSADSHHFPYLRFFSMIGFHL